MTLFYLYVIVFLAHCQLVVLGGSKLKRLCEIERSDEFNIFTIESEKAILSRKERMLRVILTDYSRVLTTSRERRHHFKRFNKDWLLAELRKKSEGVEIATEISPLEFLTGDVCLLLEIEGKLYALEYLRDIEPRGWLLPGGCPRSLEELFNPRRVAEREVSEEVIIGDVEGSFYSFDFYPREKVVFNEKEHETRLLKTEELFFGNGDANTLIFLRGTQTHILKGNFFIDWKTGSVANCFYRLVKFLGRLEDIQIYDGERTEDGNLINRSARLIDPTDKSLHALFRSGKNLLLKENRNILKNIDIFKYGWNRPVAEEMVSIY